MAQVYTARVRVRHHEVDAFGRVTPATHLRTLTQVAIDASDAAGFDGGWYAAAGAHWLVRRSTFTLHRHAGAGTDLDIRTWVEDFRRVLSARRYEMQTASGRPVLSALTDWVYVDAASGRIRRIPEEMEERFGVRGGSLATSRPPFRLPAPPPEPARVRTAVRWSDLDALAHVNNAAYLDVLMQAVFDVLARFGWPLARLVSDGALPAVQAGDLEYLDAAVHGDELDTVTWFTAAPHGLDAHQRILRAGDGRALVQASTSWRWHAAGLAEPAPPPPGLPDAVRPLIAA